MAVASAGPYASLHLAPDRQPHQHPGYTYKTVRYIHTDAVIGVEYAFKVNNFGQIWSYVYRKEEISCV